MLLLLLLTASAAQPRVAILPFEQATPGASTDSLAESAAAAVQALGCEAVVLRGDAGVQLRRAASACSGDAACLMQVGALVPADRLLAGRVAPRPEPGPELVIHITDARSGASEEVVAHLPAGTAHLASALERVLAGYCKPAGPAPPSAVDASAGALAVRLVPDELALARDRPSGGVSPTDAPRAPDNPAAPAPAAGDAGADPLPPMPPDADSPSREPAPRPEDATVPPALAPPAARPASAEPDGAIARPAPAPPAGLPAWAAALRLPRAPRARAATLATAGVSLALAAAGAAFGMAALSSISDQGAARSPAEHYAASEDLRRRARAANVSFGVAGFGAAACATLWLGGDELGSSGK